MAQNFIECDREQVFLMPPSLREWLPEDHLAWFVLEAVEEMDLTEFYGDYRSDGHGRAAYEPSMMVALLLYAYATEQRSSRRIEIHCPAACNVVADLASERHTNPAPDARSGPGFERMVPWPPQARIPRRCDSRPSSARDTWTSSSFASVSCASAAAPAHRAELERQLLACQRTPGVPTAGTPRLVRSENRSETLSSVDRESPHHPSAQQRLASIRR